jgi:hypothetical protein
MFLDIKEIPRKFQVNDIEIKDFGKINLDENEMISFKTNSNKEYDFISKEWGFYATSSINGRLKKEGFKTALVVNEFNKIYIMIVEVDKIDEFKIYLKDNQDNKIICWLDDFFMEDI